MKVRITLKNNIGCELTHTDINVDDESSPSISRAVHRLAAESIICTGDTIAIEEVD